MAVFKSVRNLSSIIVLYGSAAIAERERENRQITDLLSGRISGERTGVLCECTLHVAFQAVWPLSGRRILLLLRLLVLWWNLRLRASLLRLLL